MATTNLIDTAPKRKRLEIRREPYWSKIGKGQFLGFRATQSGGTWIARVGKNHTRLADGPVMTYSEALSAAIKVFDQAGIVGTGRYTLQHCLDDYVRHLEINKTISAAKEARSRLGGKLPESLLKKPVKSLTAAEIKNWLVSMVRVDDDPERVRQSKAGANRVLAMLKAALNLAYRDQKTPSDQAWRSVSQFNRVNKPRDLYLTEKQVARLLSATEGAFHDLCKAAVLTGARYGELRAAKVKDLDARRGTIHLSGKTGPRDCFLSDEALTFFKQLTKPKLPNAPLIPNPDGVGWKHAQQTRHMNLAKKKARLPAATVFYSLRHYHISRALIAGVNIKIVADNCGTSILMIEKTYGKFTDLDRREMMNRVAL